MSAYPRPAAIAATSLLLLPPLLLVLWGLGCQADTPCAADGTSCGGDPTGTWVVMDACRDPAFAAPTQPTYQSQPIAMARQPVPQTTSSDWCSSLIVTPQGLTSFVFPHDTLSVAGTSQLTYGGDGTYQALINTAGHGGVDLSGSCLTRFGVSLACDALATSLAAYAASRPAAGIPCTDSPSEPAKCQSSYSYGNVSCTSDGNDGCACGYDVSFWGTFNGKWTTSGSRLVHFDTSKMLPSQADYCVDGAGAALSLWGHDRTSLFGEPGLRTLKLQRMP